MFRLWHSLLLFALAIQVLLGLLLAFLGSSTMPSVLNNAIDPVFWGSATIPAEAVKFQQFAYGVLGCVTAGWGVTGLVVAYYGLPSRQRWTWYALAEGLAVWYVADTGISLAHGVTANAILNTVLFVSLAVPLGFLYRHTSGQSATTKTISA